MAEWEKFMKRDDSKVKDKSLELRTGVLQQLNTILPKAKEILQQFSDFNKTVRQNEKYAEKIVYIDQIIDEFKTVKKLLIKLQNLRKK